MRLDLIGGIRSNLDVLLLNKPKPDVNFVKKKKKIFLNCI